MEKIAKKYLELYNDPTETENLRTYENLEDYIQEKIGVYEKHFTKSSADSIFLYLTLIEEPYLVGLATAFQQKDYKLLNNTLYHATKHRLLNRLESGCDHSSDFWEVLDGMACNYKGSIEKCYPMEVGFSNNGYPLWVVASNLFMALWYENEQWMEQAYPAGEKFLSQKKGLWEKAIVAYFMALANKDIYRATVELNNVCKYSTRIERPKLTRYFCTEAHGLYQIARYVLEEEDFNQIGLPDHKTFCKGLVAWQKERGYPEEGKFIVHYPDELEMMNDILGLSLPNCRLTGTGKRKLVDIESMQKELVEEFNARRLRSM